MPEDSASIINLKMSITAAMDTIKRVGTEVRDHELRLRGLEHDIKEALHLGKEGDSEIRGEIGVMHFALKNIERSLDSISEDNKTIIELRDEIRSAANERLNLAKETLAAHTQLNELKKWQIDVDKLISKLSGTITGVRIGITFMVLGGGAMLAEAAGIINTIPNR